MAITNISRIGSAAAVFLLALCPPWPRTRSRSAVR